MSGREEIAARFVGPVKDPNRNRTVKLGALSVEHSSLRLRLTDETHVRITISDADDLRKLAAMLTEAADKLDDRAALRRLFRL